MPKKKILVISSFPPYHSAGLAIDLITALRLAGCDVDFLTRYKYKGQKKNEFALCQISKRVRLNKWVQKKREKYRCLRFFRVLYHMALRLKILSSTPAAHVTTGKINIVCEDETRPVVDPKVIVSKIRKQYDYVITTFSWDMISAATIEAIYGKLKCPIIMEPVDMSFTTGGCFYTGDCQNYKNECTNCPAFVAKENKDQAHKNFLYKKNVYSKVNCLMVTNSHVKRYIIDSKIISEDKLFLMSFCIDDSKFKPIDMSMCRKSFGISEKKKFIILCRYSDEARRGAVYMKDAIDDFTSKLTLEQKDSILLAFVGTYTCGLSFDVDTKCLGFLNERNLINAYNASSVFLCASIDDAGPSMVNQSMACGTPVVAFEQGTALDVLENGISGYRAKLKDSENLAKGLFSIFNLSDPEYKVLRETTRKKAMDNNSIQATANSYKTMFEHFDKK